MVGWCFVIPKDADPTCHWIGRRPPDNSLQAADLNSSVGLVMLARTKALLSTQPDASNPRGLLSDILGAPLRRKRSAKTGRAASPRWPHASPTAFPSGCSGILMNGPSPGAQWRRAPRIVDWSRMVRVTKASGRSPASLSFVGCGARDHPTDHHGRDRSCSISPRFDSRGLPRGSGFAELSLHGFRACF
jgi:hypothetical protein